MKFIKYESRLEAGKILANLIQKENQELWDSVLKNPKNFFCFAIPNGGIPVAEGFCSILKIKYDFLIVRKIKIPWNTEAGFGSITTDGTLLINQPLYDQLKLTNEQLNNSIEITKNEIKERLKLYNKEDIKDKNYFKNINRKSIFMIDDGLASGFTMLAAIKMVKNYDPNQIFISVPTAPISTVNRIKDKVDYIFCPNTRDVWRFAVAEAYKSWYDVPESEVIDIINVSKYYLKM
ncbi:MAG: phosphoribosyltransferase [Promethearchaeota archaeon]